MHAVKKSIIEALKNNMVWNDSKSPRNAKKKFFVAAENGGGGGWYVMWRDETFPPLLSNFQAWKLIFFYLKYAYNFGPITTNTLFTTGFLTIKLRLSFYKKKNNPMLGRGRMRSFLEPKPKFWATPFFKLFFFVPVFLIPIWIWDCH